MITYKAFQRKSLGNKVYSLDPDLRMFGCVTLIQQGTWIESSMGWDWSNLSENLSSQEKLSLQLNQPRVPIPKTSTQFPPCFTYRWTKQIKQAYEAYAAGDTWAAIIRLILTAEQGSDQAAINAAWILRRGLQSTNTGEEYVCALDQLWESYHVYRIWSSSQANLNPQVPWYLFRLCNQLMIHMQSYMLNRGSLYIVSN